MPSDTVCKIIRQYNSAPIPAEDMQKLQEIAEDYASVKNYVYQRYGGIRSLHKIYPGYTVQNEMTQSGLREKLDMPSVYFYLAVFDALKEIKICWSAVKTRVLKQVNIHEGLTEEEKHFLRYLLKVNNAFETVLMGIPLKLPKEIQKQYNALSACVDVKKMESYLRRQVRRHSRKLHADKAEGFSIGERAYRYDNRGVYISVKQKRKRVFIPLTDGKRYTRQLYIRLYPDRRDVELRVPVNVRVKKHPDYDRSVGISIGMTSLLVTDEGHQYGGEFGDYQSRFSEWLREQTRIYQKNRGANSGREKYQAKKHRMEEQLHSYINQELNRFLREERPQIVYMPKLPGGGVKGPVKKFNYMASTWQRGYIKSRLVQKCREQSVTLVEVFAKDISNECSRCGAAGNKKDGWFTCPFCGYMVQQRTNTAKNAKKRGETGTNPYSLHQIIEIQTLDE